MRIYLDNCCFNRPFDDQMQIRISLETEAKLFIQSLIATSKVDFVWSYMLFYENSNNPFEVRRTAIINFSKYAKYTVTANNDILTIANEINKRGIKEKDSLHIACAIYAKCDYFITTDDRILKYKDDTIEIVDPNDFIKVWVEDDYE